MRADDILLLGLKQHVLAISRADGTEFWRTKLPDGSGQGFISIVSDTRLVYATCNGVLHCLELLSGDIVWTNPLKGFGYGIASLCLPGQPPGAQAGAAARYAADSAGATSAGGGAAAT